jgi:predicted DNA-binding transcriptional regulator AlpA
MSKPNIESISVSVPVAAQMLSLSRTRMYELVGQGIVRSTMIGGRRVVLVSSLRELVGEGVDKAA